MPHKKIVFVIVEGPSDEEALGVLLNRIYDSKAVYVRVMHCDITTELDVNAGNVVAKIGDVVKNYAGRTFKPRDFSRIIHITDMDGAFIPDDAIVEDAAAVDPFYSVTEIRTQRKSGIENRNRQKRECLNRLSSASRIWGVPYQIYYMSCNLDHALYGKLNSTDDEKEADAFAFAKKYRDDIPGFMKYISEGLHSLERNTNLGLCFQEEAIDSENKPNPEEVR